MAQPDDAQAVPDRRSFLSRMIGGSAVVFALTGVAATAAYLAPAGRALETGEGPSDAGALADLPPGRARTLQLGEHPVLLIHDGDEVVALSAACPHHGCIVAWDPARRQVACPCHAGTFDLRGNVLSGPPPRALTAFPVQIRDGHIYIGGEPV